MPPLFARRAQKTVPGGRVVPHHPRDKRSLACYTCGMHDYDSKLVLVLTIRGSGGGKGTYTGSCIRPSSQDSLLMDVNKKNPAAVSSLFPATCHREDSGDGKEQKNKNVSHRPVGWGPSVHYGYFASILFHLVCVFNYGQKRQRYVPEKILPGIGIK